MLMTAHPGNGGFELAFGIDQKVRRSYNSLARLEACGDCDPIAQPIPNLNLPWFQVAVAAIDENCLLGSTIEYGIGGYSQLTI